MNYYEILGAPEDATQEELHQAYLAKQAQLAPERFVGAPDDVLGAVKRASVVVDQAWNVLGEVALRANYDADLSLSATNAEHAPSEAHEGWRRHHAEHVWAMERQLGLPFTSVLGIHPSTADGTGPDILKASSSPRCCLRSSGSLLRSTTRSPLPRGLPTSSRQVVGPTRT